MPGGLGTADELDRQVTLKEDLAAHAGNYEESGITDPRILTGELPEPESLLDRLPEDLKAGAGLYEETGMTEPLEYEARFSRSSQSTFDRITTGHRTDMPSDLRKDPHRMAEFYRAEFANSSSSEEVVASERGMDDPLAPNQSQSQSQSQGSQAYRQNASSPSQLADEVRAKYGRKPSSNSRPRGGLESIPLCEDEEAVEAAKRGSNRQ